MLIDAIDSYYEYVKTRIVTGMAVDIYGNNLSPAFPPINSNRVFMGYAEAQSWPPNNIKFGALYLVITNQFPVKGGTKGNQLYRTTAQWTWVIEGDDIQAGTAGQNRGDRFRLEQALREELRQANFPGFCPLLTVSSVNGIVTRTPYTPVTMCKWTDLSFGPRPSVADDSGVLYGAAAVDVYAYQQPLTQ